MIPKAVVDVGALANRVGENAVLATTILKSDVLRDEAMLLDSAIRMSGR